MNTYRWTAQSRSTTCQSCGIQRCKNIWAANPRPTLKACCKMFTGLWERLDISPRIASVPCTLVRYVYRGGRHIGGLNNRIHSIMLARRPDDLQHKWFCYCDFGSESVCNRVRTSCLMLKVWPRQDFMLCSARKNCVTLYVLHIPRLLCERHTSYTNIPVVVTPVMLRVLTLCCYIDLNQNIQD